MHMETKKVLFIGSMHFFLDSYMGFFAIYFVIAKLDPVRAALIATITIFTGNILQPFFGYAADRIRGKLPVFIGLCITSISMSLLGMTRAYPLLFIMVLFGQVGSSFFHPAGANIAGAAGSSTDRSFAIFSTIGTVGYSLSQPIFSAFTGWVGLSRSYFLALPCLCLAFFYLAFSSTGIQGPEKELDFGEFRRIIKKRFWPILLLFFIMVLRSAFIISVITFLAKAFDDWGFPRNVYSIAAPVFMLSGAGGILLAGHVTHRIRPRKLMAFTLTAFLPFFIWFLLHGENGSVGTSFVLLALSGFIIHGGHAANIVMGHRVVPEMTSTISGILMGFAWATSSFGPTVTAVTGDTIRGFPGITSGLLLVSTLPVVAAVLSLLLPTEVDG
jgi:FSR family fosmidomycin resistance protein-like MFS transporter